MDILDIVFDLGKFTNTLRAELGNGLPGFDAQKKMSPSSRRGGMLRGSDLSIAKDSSVLLLFYPKNGQLYLPLIKRSSGNTNHGGQIGLPGGKYEEDDADRTETAVRETNEELGVSRKEIKILGHLTEIYIPVSNFKVFPVIGICEERPFFRLNSFEVEEVIEMPVGQLLSKNNIGKFTFKKGGLRVTAPYFEAKGYKIWGATAMILSELRELLLRAGLVW